MYIENVVKNIYLRPFTLTEAKKTYDWIKDPELRRLFLMRGDIPDWQTHENYWRNKLEDSSQKLFAIFIVVENIDIHIGNCGLKNIQNEEAEFWIYIGEQNYRARGYGKLASKQLFDIAFNDMKLNRIYLYVKRNNLPALKMYQSLGFKEITSDENSEKIWDGREDNIVKFEIIFSQKYKESTL